MEEPVIYDFCGGNILINYCKENLKPVSIAGFFVHSFYQTIFMNQIALENLFLIDIETVSEKEHFHLLDDTWKELWIEKVRRHLPPDTSAEEFYPARAAILAEFAKVACISFGYFKKENNEWKLRIKSLYSDNEPEILNQFINTVKQLYNNNQSWIFTGHNIKEFDVPFLCRRMLIN